MVGIILLNLGNELIDSDERLLPGDINDYPFAQEKWFFINGVMVGSHWLKSAVNEISRLFHRRVVGIHCRTLDPSRCISNPSWGLIFDLVQCVVQRDYGYTTRDVRIVYIYIKKALLDDRLKKVIVVAHSQGGLSLSMALDNLLSDLPRECTSPSLFTDMETSEN